MAGIYIHIPFCRQACHYCDFHFSTTFGKYRDQMIASIIREAELQTDYLNNEKVETIYFGGGTPSLLSAWELDSIFDCIYKHYSIDAEAEITIETNPDDLDANKLKEFQGLPINRLSIGIQSFEDKDLQLLNRAHDSEKAIGSVKMAQEAGFDNITIDLIFGIPGSNLRLWEQNLQKTLSLNVPHISAYNLTIEQGTALEHFIRNGKLKATGDETSARQFEKLISTLDAGGYDHYEISNFGKPGYYSKHNSSYWKGMPYLGLGPSAHSYNRISRSWNISHNIKYIHALSEGKLSLETEVLSENDRYNEYVMTSLRTIWGCDLDYIAREFGDNRLDYLILKINPYLESGSLLKSGNIVALTGKGKLIADRIASDVFITD